MTQLTSQQSEPTVADEDLAEQARPGHGIPSQDPDGAAQLAMEPEEAQREAHSVLTGGGMVAGAATGAAIGIAVGGPVGVVVGAAVGAVAGALGGAAAASGVDTEDSGATTAPANLADAVHLHVEDSGSNSSATSASGGGTGSGRTVVLIHGWPLSAQVWAPQKAALIEAGYRVVAYDRRGFGRSDKPDTGYRYDVLADDLERVLDQCDLQDVTLVGFSMGGGEVARYITRWGESRLHSVVFAAAVPPFLLHTADNPEGPLSAEKSRASRAALEHDRSSFFDEFTKNFFSANGVLKVTDFQRAEATALCQQSAPHAALACMDAFSMTDFRDDLKKVAVPTLVIHGDADAIVPIEGSGLRTHRAIAHSKLVRIAGAPHGMNVSHAQEFNAALLAFLKAPEWQ
jgi:pimeloyl-ACP methyl ester carboxylesterase